MQIAERLIQITNDLKYHYVDEFGSPAEWSLIQQDIYFLNCDSEVCFFLDKNDIEIHDDVYRYGVSFGIIIIQKEIMRYYMENHSDSMTYGVKDEMFEVIKKKIYNYISTGVYDAY